MKLQMHGSFLIRSGKTQCGKTRNYLSLFFKKNFVKATFFTYKNLLRIVDFTKKFGEREFLVFPHCEKVNFLKKNREINL